MKEIALGVQKGAVEIGKNIMGSAFLRIVVLLCFFNRQGWQATIGQH